MAVIHLRREPVRHGELLVLKDLTELDEAWHVFYSLDFLDRDRSFDRKRELDFLVLHPTKGAIFIEVKGGQVRFDRGNVEQFLLGGWTPQDPVKQLNNARRVSLDFMKRSVSAFIPARNIYCFPAIERPPSGLSQELMDAGLFGAECRDLASHIEDLCRDAVCQVPLDVLLQPLEACLTLDVGEAVGEQPGNDRYSALTLQDLSTANVIGGGIVFSSLGDVRSVVGDHRARLQHLWEDICRGATELEMADGLDTSSEADLLSSLMGETDNVLASSTIDIGVFGQVKRGKSTLVNALVGSEVSAVGMLPKTAVPVVIEWAPEEAGVVTFRNGTQQVVSLAAAVEATTQSDRKRRIRDASPLVDRVLVRLPLDWLPQGVRIIDTPGLEDPSLSDVYEEYTMAELSRLAAGIFVISYPPGPEAGEMRLLSTLGTHGMSKMFFVANMWSDAWHQKGARKEVTEYVEMLLSASNPEERSFHGSDATVFAVNLGSARDAIRDGDSKALVESGLNDLQEALEAFVHRDALSRIATSAARRLTEASRVVEATLAMRERVLNSPERVKQMRSDLQRRVESSSAIVADIVKTAELLCRKLHLELDEMASEPFHRARSKLASTSQRSVLVKLERRLAVESATVASRLSTTMLSRSNEIVSACRRELTARLGDATWSFDESLKLDTIYTAEFGTPAVAPERGPTSYTTEGRGLGSILGAMLGGGGGIALAATGPVGLIVGGLLGYALGDAFGNIFSDQGNSGEASPAEISRLIEQLNKAEVASLKGVAEAVDAFTKQLRNSLHRQRDLLLQGSHREIQVLERLLKDDLSRQRARQDITAWRASLKAITG
jgi:hypothetical protein